MTEKQLDIGMSVKAKPRDSWERIWNETDVTFRDYLFDPHLGIEHGDITPLVRTILQEAGSPVLEAGCGRGPWLEWLAYHGHESVGLDYADQTLHWLSRQRPDFLLTTGDVRRLPYADGAFSVVMSWGVLEHLPVREDFRNALLEAYRVLCDGGWLCITVPCFNWIRQIKRPFRFLKDRARVYVKGVDLRNEFFEYKFSRTPLVKLIRSAGFVPRVTGYNSPGFGLTSEFPFRRYRKVRDDGEYGGVTGLGTYTLKITQRLPQFAAHMIFVGGQKITADRNTLRVAECGTGENIT